VKEFWTRYGWWLLLLCVALAALIVHRLSPRFTREQYDRIRLGMTPAEVSQSMDSPPSEVERFVRIPPNLYINDPYELVDLQSDKRPSAYEKMQLWKDGSVIIGVSYQDGKAVLKIMWKAKAPQ
jgi:hypothetical protein